MDSKGGGGGGGGGRGATPTPPLDSPLTHRAVPCRSVAKKWEGQPGCAADLDLYSALHGRPRQVRKTFWPWYIYFIALRKLFDYSFH